MQTETARPLPPFYIGKQLTRQRIDKYINEKHGILSEEIDKEDTKSIWYSRDHFATLLEEIDAAGGDGIRIFFGAYEDGHEFAGQLCLLFNSTREIIVNGSIVHANVYLENELDYSARTAQSRDFIIHPIDGLKPKDRDFNFGQPCPPRCGDSGEGGEDGGEG